MTARMTANAFNFKAYLVLELEGFPLALVWALAALVWALAALVWALVLVPLVLLVSDSAFLCLQ